MYNETDLRRFTPIDPLTRLMMDADGVSVSEMEALMLRLSRTLATRDATSRPCDRHAALEDRHLAFP